MILYPAIDILDGICVRLHKGNFDEVSSYNDDPLAMAQIFEKSCTAWLHVVDLSGAKDSNSRQIHIIEQIVKNTNLKIQTGGGIRSRDDVAHLLSVGVQRVVIGSLAVRNKDLTKSIVKEFGADKIVLALDVMNEMIAVSGWTETTTTSIFDIINEYIPFGLKHVLCTDIDRDGTMIGPNIDLYKKISNTYPQLSLQASGGIGSLSDIEILSKNNINGAVIGKALYEGLFTLNQALKVASC